MYYFLMNKTPDLTYSGLQRSVDEAHRRLAGEALGDISISVLIKHSARLLTELMNRELKAFGLSHSSYVTLMCLASSDHERTNPSVLCHSTGETRANMTRICDELVDLGLIRRIANSEDRRRVDLSLSEAGVELLKTVVPAVRICAKQAVSTLDEAEKASLKANLGKLMAALEDQL